MDRQKHILVVGGMRPVHKTLKKLNAKVTLIHGREKLKGKDANLYDRIIGIENIENMEEWIEVVKAIHKVDPIHAIGAFHEKLQDKAALVAKSLNLDFYTEETIKNISNKYNMRKKLKESGVEHIKFAKVKNKNDIKEFLSEAGYPAVLKPIDSWGSMGVSVIRKHSDIDSAIKASSSDGDMLIEEYIEGEELSVEVFSHRGNHYVLSITRKYKNSISLVEEGHSVLIDLPPDLKQKIEKKVIDYLTVLGLTHGPSHTEIIIDKDKNVKLIETHTRLGGDFIPELIEKSTDLDLVELTAKQVLENEIEIPPIKVKKHHAIWYLLPNKEGTVIEVKGVDNAKEDKGVVEVNLLKQKEESVSLVSNSFDRLAYVIANGDSSEEAIENAKNAASKINYKLG